MKKLTPQALKIIRSNGKLFGEISDYLGLAPVSFRDMVTANTDERLVSAGVLDLIKNHLAEMKNMELVEAAA